MNRFYPLSEGVFNEEILAKATPLEGRPPKISHYRCFCAMLKMLSCSMPRGDCSREYGPWHAHASKNGVKTVCFGKF
ncbi:MAG: hypothetical protein LBC04_01380 [Holosporaceae bacterium]|nr:hypothetical protein [Holosporaceae bacterium]